MPKFLPTSSEILAECNKRMILAYWREVAAFIREMERPYPHTIHGEHIQIKVPQRWKVCPDSSKTS